MTLEIYTELKNDINTKLDIADIKVKSFKRGSNGMVEMTNDFREANRNFNLIFKQLQTLNKYTSNKIKMEYSKIKRK
jgi:hypothetical protein